MKDLSRFIRLKKLELIVFGIYVFLLIFSKNLGIDYKYLLYICLISCFIFLTYMVLSYNNYKNTKEKLLDWINDPSKNPPEFIKNSEVYDLLHKEFSEKVELSNDYSKKIEDFKDYMTMWTHQIKTPLFSLNLILDDYPIDIHQAKAEIFEIEEYMQTLLSYFRLESKTTDYVFENLSLDEIIRTSIKKYSKVFILRKNKINFKETNVKITTDKKWFGFLLDQIFSNANKYTKNGEISIFLKESELVIKDTGIGIRKEDLKRVFEKSYTGYNGRIYQKSTGLGLNMVKTICEKLTIDVYIKSEVNIGTEVILNLKRTLN